MALKPDRYVVETDITFHMNEVAERGVVVSYSTAGSGAALDQGAALVTVSADPSGKRPLGMLMNDMVDNDLTRISINVFKDEMQKGGKVTLLRKGWLVTNKIVGTPTVGQAAYLGASGNVTPTQATYALQVGEFQSVKDEDGYAKVAINLP